ncbi:MAG TPA: recombinase family protein, partial [Acidimicrobiia bacterium]|nr:recombinase family protein [Acidimicrobiia bacterium]
DPSQVIAYTRVSTEEQAVSGLGLKAQETAIRTATAARGADLVAIYSDPGISGAVAPEDRPGLTDALGAVGPGRAGVLMVAKLDRLTRTVLDFAFLMQRSQREGWALVTLDLGVDTSTPQGELMANVFATFAQFERRLIGQRTKDALAVKRAQGVRLGRPVTLPSAVRERIVAERRAGATMAAIAAGLTADAVPTAQGGARWHASTVQSVLRSVELDQEIGGTAA